MDSRPIRESLKKALADFQPECRDYQFNQENWLRMMDSLNWLLSAEKDSSGVGGKTEVNSNFTGPSDPAVDY